MKASAYAGPMVARTLAQQALAERLSRRAERIALSLAGGGGFSVPHPASLPAARRARSSFALAGGELCSCSSSGCPTCQAEAAQEGLACPCGKASCRACAPAPPAGLIGFAFPGWGAPAAAPPAPPAGPVFTPGGAIIVFPTLPNIHLPDIVEPTTSSTAEGHGGWTTPTVVCDGDYFDMHSHNFCSTYTDWALAEGGAAGTETENRADSLHSLHDYGVGCMVISGQADTGAGSDPITDYATMNDVTLFVTALYPDYFVPFLQVIPKDGAFDSTAAEYVAARLEDGFQGLGELFIHGHHGNVNDLEPLTSMCRAAAARGVPVQCHWEIGNVDDSTVRTAEENYLQLVALLNAFPNVPIAGYTTYSEDEPVPLKFILCHCGAGAGDMESTSSTFSDYKDRVEYLLTNYPNVYFDLAGMQIGGVQQLYTSPGRVDTPTALGEFLLAKMADFPTRFLVGIDTNLSASTAASYGNSVANYGAFLGLGSLLPADQYLIQVANGFVVLYTTASLLTVSVSSTSTSSSWSWP